MNSVVYLRLGRAYCPTCHVVRVYVADAEVTELRCPCGAMTRPAHQDDAEERGPRHP